MERRSYWSTLLVPSVSNFSANRLFPCLADGVWFQCGVLLEDHDTQRVYWRYGFSKAQLIRSGVAYCVAGKVNSADELYLVIESVRLDTEYARSSTVPAPADGARGSATS